MDMDVAVCHGPREVAVERAPVESPGREEVLVRVAYCGVCPWDVRAYTGGSRSVHYPLRLGHEATGVVESVGEGTAALGVGDRVVVDVIRRCGRCQPCQRGLENHCENADYSRGGFAEYLLAPARNVHRLRDKTSLMAAAMTEPLACVVRGLNHIRAAEEDVVLVAGAGPIGLLHVQLLVERGATVIVSDLIDDRLETASDLGAVETIRPDADSLIDKAMAVTDGFGVDAVVIATSEIDAVSQTLPLLGIGGRLLLFAGIYPDSKLMLDLNRIHYGEFALTGSSDYTSVEFAQALEHIETGAVEVVPLVSQVFPLADVAEALGAVESNSGLKVLVRCDEREAFEQGGFTYERKVQTS